MSAKRILLCRLGGIGDVIQTLPLVKFLKKKYTNANIEYLTSENVCELLLNCCPYIDKVWNFNLPNSRLIAELKDSGLRFDCFFNLHGSLRFFFFNFFHTKAKKYFQYKKNKDMHAVLNFARIDDPGLSFFNLDSHTLYIKDSYEFLEKYELKKNKYVCFVIGVGGIRPNRSWTFLNWIKLAKEFLNIKKDFKIVFLGGVDEEKKFSNLIDIKSDRLINLLGKLTLSSNAQIISTSELVVSCDTGLLHLASGLGKKVIGLFGPTLPERTGPYSTNSKILTTNNCECIGLKKCKKSKEPWGYCMDSLKVEDVLSELVKAFHEVPLYSVR